MRSSGHDVDARVRRRGVGGPVRCFPAAEGRGRVRLPVRQAHEQADRPPGRRGELSALLVVLARRGPDVRGARVPLAAVRARVSHRTVHAVEESGGHPLVGWSPFFLPMRSWSSGPCLVSPPGSSSWSSAGGIQ